MKPSTYSPAEGDEVWVERFTGAVPAVVLWVEPEGVRVRYDGGGQVSRVSADRLRPRGRRVTTTGAVTRPFSHSRAEGREVPKPEARFKSERYLKHVRSYPCCVCGAEPPSEAHHFDDAISGMGRKPDDTATAPLCPQHHFEWHDRGRFGMHTRDYSVRLQLDAQRQCMRDFIRKGASRG